MIYSSHYLSLRRERSRVWAQLLRLESYSRTFSGLPGKYVNVYLPSFTGPESYHAYPQLLHVIICAIHPAITKYCDGHILHPLEWTPEYLLFWLDKFHLFPSELQMQKHWFVSSRICCKDFGPVINLPSGNWEMKRSWATNTDRNVHFCNLDGVYIMPTVSRRCCEDGSLIWRG